MKMHISSVTQRTNELMTMLTPMATIFIPMSFLAGLYGMNFGTEASPWNLPDLDRHFGYPFALGLMASMAVGLGIHFRRRG